MYWFCYFYLCYFIIFHGYWFIPARLVPVINFIFDILLLLNKDPAASAILLLMFSLTNIAASEIEPLVPHSSFFKAFYNCLKFYPAILITCTFSTFSCLYALIVSSNMDYRQIGIYIFSVGYLYFVIEFLTALRKLRLATKFPIKVWHIVLSAFTNFIIYWYDFHILLITEYPDQDNNILFAVLMLQVLTLYLLIAWLIGDIDFLPKVL